MKIEFLGTGSVRAPQLSSSILIDEDLLIDVGNGIVNRMKQTGHKIVDIENCLITHLHGDHFADIPFLIVDRIGGKNPMRIYGPKGLEERMRKLFDLLVFPMDFETAKEKAKVQFIEFDKMEKENIGKETYVSAFEVEHEDCKPAYGYIVERRNHKIGFSGDSSYCEAVSKIVGQSEIAILDMCFIESKKGHMGIEDITNFAMTYPNKKIATTHMQEETREEATKKGIKNLIVPEDGHIIEL